MLYSVIKQSVYSKWPPFANLSSEIYNNYDVYLKLIGPRAVAPCLWLNLDGKIFFNASH